MAAAGGVPESCGGKTCRNQDDGESGRHHTARGALAVHGAMRILRAWHRPWGFVGCPTPMHTAPAATSWAQYVSEENVCGGTGGVIRS